MGVIDEVRLDREDLARVLKKHAGIRKIVEDLYPDSAHFIYELLQNAEDTGATEARFVLSPTSLAFEHNGRPFEQRDIEGITDIGEGTKAADDDKIGRFGVGFKAVFAYSETPHIWSPTFSFKINDLVLPLEIDSRKDLGSKTRFEFPFNNPKKSVDIAHAEVREGLNELAVTTLLFLPNLESIAWQVGSEISGEILRIHHKDNHFEILRQVDEKQIGSSHFLKFDTPVNGLEKQHLAIAFELDFLSKVIAFDQKKSLAEQMRITPAMPGRVAVFFPAEKETSGLRFHLHAPFVPELSRASIKETPVNRPLFEQVAELTASSLHQIRDLGLLTGDFLAVLPNPQDQLSLRYQGIREAIIQEMNTEPLTPTYDKTHAPAQFLLQAKASLKELLSNDDIEFLVDYDDEPPQWAIAAQKNSNADRFLAGLDITEWDSHKFVELLRKQARESFFDYQGKPHLLHEPDKGFMAWLSLKLADWHQNLYAFLWQELENQGEVLKLIEAKIVLLGSGGHSTGNRCYFPSDSAAQEVLFPTVNSEAYSFGKNKSRQEMARKFLEAVGVKEVGEVVQIEAVLQARYKDGDTFEPNINDFPRFVALIEKEPGRAKMFSEYRILKGKHGKWAKPDQVYLDSPFQSTGLSVWYGHYFFMHDEGEWANESCWPLADDYLSCGVEFCLVAKFVQAVGGRTQLKISTTTCGTNPSWTYLAAVPGDRYTSPKNVDYMMVGLRNVLASPDIEKSKLLWKTIGAIPARFFVAVYQKNETNGYRVADSQLLHDLKCLKWIPQGDHIFVRPKDASRELLPPGFTYDKAHEWLVRLGFGEALSQRAEAEREAQLTRQNLAIKLGFSDEKALADAQKFAGLPPEERQRVIEEYEQRKRFELPDHEPSNPGRRRNMVGQQASDALGKTTEKRQRSVSVGRDEVKKEAAQYLTQLYTNGDGVMICQVCKAPLPFKLDDGSFYFEKVEFLPPLAKRHHQNYLALCPNHAAMFQYANSTKELMQEMFAELSGNELEVVLAQEDATIYFTKTHIADLQVVLHTESGGSDEQPDSEQEDD